MPADLGVTGETLNLRHVHSIAEKAGPDSKGLGIMQSGVKRDGSKRNDLGQNHRATLRDKTEKSASKVKVDIDLLKGGEKIEVKPGVQQFDNDQAIFRRKRKFSNQDLDEKGSAHAKGIEFKEAALKGVSSQNAKEYQVMEAQPNMLSISFSDSKGSGENVNSERRRDKIALALQLAAKNSPVDEFEIQGRPAINMETNYPRYEDRYE